MARKVTWTKASDARDRAAEAAAEATHQQTAVAPPAAAAESADLTAAAFFDVDNTMMRGASVYQLVRGLAARNYFKTSDLVRFAYRQLKFMLSGEDIDDVSTVREEALSFIAGKQVSEIVRVGEEIYDESIADKIYAGTLELAQRHLDAGQRVYLVTATPVELAEIIARRLGLTGALGTVAASENGLYTGELVGDLLHGRAKAAAVRALAAREGLDLRRCTAYSDSVNDVPMLSVVGTAVAVNPDSQLRDYARKRGWQIRDFRSRKKVTKVAPFGLAALVIGIGAAAAVVVLRRRRA